MVRPMSDSTTAPERVRTRFEDKAQQFDDLYEDERWLGRTLRPGRFRRRKRAVATVGRYANPRRTPPGGTAPGGGGRPGSRSRGAGPVRLFTGDSISPSR